MDVDLERDGDFERALADAQRHDRDAMAWLWTRHQPALVGWLRASQPQLADDIASDAWIDAFGNLRAFDGNEADFRTWLFTIARRRLIDRVRRAERFPRLPNEVTTEDAAENIALTNLSSDEAVGTIREVLKPEHAEILLLRVLGGLTVEQVAEVTGKSGGAVRVIQLRSLRKLARHLANATKVPESRSEV